MLLRYFLKGLLLPPASLLLLMLAGVLLRRRWPRLGPLLALAGFLLLWAIGPCWQRWLAHPRLAGAVSGINAAVVGLLLAALYQPVWLSAVLAPLDLALAAIAFYLLRVLKLPILALATLLAGAALLLV